MASDSVPPSTTERSSSRRDAAHFGLEVLLALLTVAWVAWSFWPLPAAAAPDDYLAAKARELQFDPKRIIDFVNTSIADDEYAGVLRGALGTLWSGSGDRNDRALLLQALLDRSNRRTHLLSGTDLGVEADLGNGFAWAGPGPAPPSAGTVVETYPPALAHTLKVQLVTATATGPRTEDLGTFDTAALVGGDLVLTYRSTPGAEATLRTPAGDVVSSVPANQASEQSLVLTSSGPGGASPTVVRRRLFGEGRGSGPFDVGARFTIVVSAGWIPTAVGDREGDLARSGLAGDELRAAAAHAVAYRLLALSDAETARLMASRHVTARVLRPRITIVAEAAADGGRGYTLDLRADDVDVIGDGAVTFATIRSLYDSLLESRVLARTLGVPATSAADALAAALDGRVATPAARGTTLAASLARLLGPDEGDGATLDVSVEGKPDLSIHFVRAGASLTVTPSAKLQAALTGSPAAEVLHGSVTDTSLAASDAELSLVVGAHAGLGFREVIAHTPASPRHFYEGSRLLFYYPDLGYEISAVDTDGGLTFSITNHYDIDGNHLDTPEVSTIVVAAEDRAHGHTYTTYYSLAGDATVGRTWKLFSQDVLAELKTPSGSLVNVRDGSGNDVPVRLWAVGSRTFDGLVNGAVVKIPVIDVAGDLESNSPTKPANLDAVESRTDDHDSVINKYVVVDDPAFPFEIGGSGLAIQSAVPGRVVDATTGAPIAGATVSIAGSTSVTWPDGSFALPAIQQPYGTFDASVSAPGYADAATSVDLAAANAFPLSLSLAAAAPAASRWATLDAANVAGTIASLTLADVEQGLVSEVLAGEPGGSPPALAALVPQGDLQAALADARAWVALTTGDAVAAGGAAGAEGAAYVLGADGLYGGSAGAASDATLGSVTGYSGALQCAYLKAASALDAAVTQKIGGGSGGSGGSAGSPLPAANADSPQAILADVAVIAAGLAGAPAVSPNAAQDELAKSAAVAAELARAASGDSAIPGGAGGGFAASADGTSCQVEPAAAPAGPTGPPSTPASPFRPPWWPSVLGPVLILFTERDRRRNPKPKDPCAEARAKAEAAVAEAARLRAKAREARAALEAARVRRAAAEQAVADATEDENWSEATSGRLKGVRLTRRALRMQREAEAAIRARRARGEITTEEAQAELAKWADPAYVEQLAREAAAAAAADAGRRKAELDEARAAEARARAAADKAETGAAAAEAEARRRKVEAEVACATPEPKTPGCEADGFEDRFAKIKDAFEGRQKELCKEFGCASGALADFEGQYNAELATALRALEAYFQGYETLVPDLEELWQAFRDMAGAEAVAAYFDKITEVLALADGLYAVGTLAEARIARLLANGIRAAGEGAEPALAAEAARLSKALGAVEETGAGAAAAASKAASAVKVAKAAVAEFGAEEAPIYLLGGDASALAAARGVKRMPGYIDVFIHGSRDGKFYIKEMSYGVTVGKQVVTVEELAEMIRAAGYTEGTPIRLFACHSGGEVVAGALVRGPAEALARLLKTRVFAPTETLWIAKGGSHFVRAKVKIRPKNFIPDDPAAWPKEFPIGPRRPWAGYGCDGQAPRMLPW